MSHVEEIICPVCKSKSGRRVERLWWMRLIPESRNYICKRCYSKFLLVFGARVYVLVNNIKKASRYVPATESAEEVHSPPQRASDEGQESSAETADVAREDVQEKEVKEDLPSEPATAPAADKPFEISPERSYYIQRTQLLNELKGELLSWGKKRFWLILIVALIVGFIAIRVLVMFILNQELRDARSAARAAEAIAAEAMETKRAAEASAAAYREQVEKLQQELQNSWQENAELERSLQALKGDTPSQRSLQAPSAAAPQRQTAAAGDVAVQAESGRVQGDVPVGRQAVKNEQDAIPLQSNALYTILVVSNREHAIPAVDKLVQELTRREFQVKSAHWANPAKATDDVEIRCTLDAVRQGNEIKEMIASIYAELALSAPQIAVRYGFPEDKSIDSEKGHYIRILF